MERTTTYQDAAGVEHCVRFDVDAFERIKTRLGLDLLAKSDSDAIQALGGNTVGLVKLLYCVLHPESEWTAFQATHFGDVLENAEAALTEAYIRFFPTRRQTALRALREKHEAAIERMLDALERSIDSGAMDAMLSSQVEAALQTMLQPPGNPSTSGNGSGEPPAF